MNYARGAAEVKRIETICRIFISEREVRLWMSGAILEDLAVFHHELHILQGLDVTQGISVHGDDVGKCPGGDHTDLAFHLEHHGGARSGALNRVHGRHSERDHAREFLRDRLRPRNSAHVGAEDDFHARLQRLLE